VFSLPRCKLPGRANARDIVWGATNKVPKLIIMSTAAVTLDPLFIPLRSVLFQGLGATKGRTNQVSEEPPKYFFALAMITMQRANADDFRLQLLRYSEPSK
jgi:hypothetical protein